MHDFEDAVPAKDFKYATETGPGANYYERTNRRATAAQSFAEARRKRETADRIVNRFIVGGIGLAVAGVLGLGITYAVAYMGSTRTVTATINSTSCNSSGKSGCTYMIYTDAGVFSDSDSFLAGKFNSSDVYNELSIPRDGTKTCTFVAKGFRNHLLSEYPNIISVTSCKVTQ